MFLLLCKVEEEESLFLWGGFGMKMKTKLEVALRLMFFIRIPELV